MDYLATLGAPCAPLADRMIEVRNLSKSFGEIDVLSDISFSVRKGETVAIKGPSGVGKSTLLRLIAGIEGDYSGEIQRAEKIAMVFQEPTLLPWRSVIDNILLVHGHLDHNSALAALDRVGIASKAAMFPGQLSLGQQRRLALARAFAGDPAVLILDEPFVSLDPEIADEMFRLTEDLISETQPATVFVTHIPSEAERFTRRILSLAGSPATLISPNPEKGKT